MSDVWSGGIVYEYFQAANDYGLVSIVGNSVSTLSDFSVLSSQIAKVSPSAVNSASYKPTNTAAQACPVESTTGSSAWEASATLPPTPNNQLCGCMVQNLTCVAKPGLTDATIATLFNTACTPINGASSICAGISANGTTGSYGAYSMCNSTDQLSWAFNAYYMEQMASNSANTDACDFGGNATTQTPTLSNACATLVNQAGAGGTGTVTSAPSGTGVVGGGGGGAAATTSGVAGIVTVPTFDFWLLTLGSYVTVAALAGAGIILL